MGKWARRAREQERLDRAENRAWAARCVLDWRKSHFYVTVTQRRLWVSAQGALRIWWQWDHNDSLSVASGWWACTAYIIRRKTRLLGRPRNRAGNEARGVKRLENKGCHVGGPTLLPNAPAPQTSALSEPNQHLRSHKYTENAKILKEPQEKKNQVRNYNLALWWPS